MQEFIACIKMRDVQEIEMLIQKLIHREGFKKLPTNLHSDFRKSFNTQLWYFLFFISIFQSLQKIPKTNSFYSYGYTGAFMPKQAKTNQNLYTNSNQTQEKKIVFSCYATLQKNDHMQNLSLEKLTLSIIAFSQ